MRPDLSCPVMYSVECWTVSNTCTAF